LFGVRNDLAYGINDPVVDDLVEVRLLEELGDLPAGTSLFFPAAGTENSRAFLPVTVTDGRVVAVDAAGRPMIVVKDHGEGRAVLSTLPIEHFAARRRGANPEDTWRLYRALGQMAGIDSLVHVEDPRVLVDAMEHADGRTFHILVSEHPEAVETDVQSTLNLTALDGTPATGPVHLDPYGVAVLVSH
jgi:beta-glucosidase